MTLLPAGDLVAAAHQTGGAILSFNVVHLESAEAIAAAAERTGRAVIMQISENCVNYHGSLAPLANAAMALAEAATAPIGLHLDHATTSALIDEAVRLGIQSVMFDAAHLAYDQNMRQTREVTERCHAHGIWVEAELGEVGGKNGVHSPRARTDPAEARRFVEATAVDALAVAVGTSHAMTSQDAVIDFARLGQLKDAVHVPLVLHGSSGTPDDELVRAIRTGITKVNIATRLTSAWTSTLRQELASTPVTVDSRKYFAAARTAMSAEAGRLLDTLGSLPSSGVVPRR